MEDQSPFISSSNSGLNPYGSPDDEQPELDRKRWEELDVLDLTGGAGGFPPSSQPHRVRDQEEEEDEKPSYSDSLEPSPEEEEPSSISSDQPAASVVPSAPMEEEEEDERPTVPSRGPTGSVAVDLIYWRDIKKSGVVFGASLFLLLSLTVFSIVSVAAYIALALLSVSISFRIYKGVLQAIQKSDEGHPFRSYLESSVAVSEDVVQKYSNVAMNHINCTIKELRRLFLVEDLVDSLKFAVLMWVFTYIGALFNGLTLLILALISLFSVPVIYERHQTQVDHYLALVNKNVKNITDMVVAKIPGLKRKAE
ncbi:reticulon-4 isoform X4 [Spea bombifrons]|uniref:reticulon-4 isoform X4 n=1 Tax=Spea bombifrons TaxID=233779 RepID=UPI00234A2657|nr:reticulon-4 isoform X4 [Spea bombifrons]